MVGSSTTTSYTAVGLTMGNNYLYKVLAVNFAGSGLLSEASDFIIAATNPDPPVNLVRLYADNTFITIGWSAPTFDGGSPVYGYKVLWD
jgi:titin